MENSQTEDFLIMSSVQDVAKLFMQAKDQLIIWHDPNVHCKENQEYIEKLQSICDVITFQDWNEAYNEIANKQAYFHVITSGTNGELLSQKIESLSNVSSISVFCGNIDSHSQWAQKYSKVISVENSFDRLLSKLTDFITVLRVDFPSFAPIFDDKDKSDMNKQHFYLTGLIGFQNREQSKRDFLSLASAIHKDKDNMENFQKNYTKYDMRSILNWYTRKTFLYKTTNNCLRIGTSDSILYSRLILKDLETAIKEQYHLKSKEYNGLLYRGAYISIQEWKQLQQNIGKDIEMFGFLSTSKKKEKALEFAKQDTINKALVTIIVPAAPDLGEQGFAEVEEFSVYPDEKEVLFNVRSRFTILEADIETVDGVQCRHLVLLFGAQAIKKYVTLEKPKIDVVIKNSEDSGVRCAVCDLGILSSEKQILFVNLLNTSEYVCEKCMPNFTSINKCPLLRVSIAENKTDKDVVNLEISGTATKYPQALELPFYGYTCTTCHGNSLSSWYCKCVTCQNQKIVFCKECFYKAEHECLKAHLIVIETCPYIFWTDKMSQHEIAHLKFLSKQLSSNAGLYPQADVFYDTHEYAKAMQYYQRFLQNNKPSLQDLGAVYNKLGQVYSELEEHRKAIEYHSKSLEIRNAIFGEQHPDTAMSYNNIGAVLFALGDHRKAIAYHSKSLEIRKAIFGEQHPDTAMSYNNIGVVFVGLGEHKKAIEYYSKSLEIDKAIFGEQHSSIAGYYNNMGKIYCDLGEPKKAIEYHSKSLEINKAIFGEHHSRTATSYNNLGTASGDLGEHEKAIEYHSKSLEIRKAFFGEQHSSTAESYDNIGVVYCALGEYEKVIEYCSKALEIYKAIFGEQHPDTGTAYNNIGAAYNGLGEHKKAIEYLSKSLEIRKAIFGEQHPDIAMSYNNIGAIYYGLEEYKNAIEFFSKALEIYKPIFGEQHPSIATLYNNIGSIYYRLEEDKNAVEYFSKSLEIYKAIFGEQHPSTLQSRKNLENARQHLNA